MNLAFTACWLKPRRNDPANPFYIDNAFLGLGAVSIANIFLWMPVIHWAALFSFTVLHFILVFCDQVVKLVAPHGSASQHPDIEPGCIITYLNGEVVGEFPQLMAALTSCTLPIRISFYNPFVVDLASNRKCIRGVHSTTMGSTFWTH